VVGVLGTAATWVASTGTRVAVSSWCCGREREREAQTPRLAGGSERQVRVFLGGKLRCSNSPSPKQSPQKWTADMDDDVLDDDMSGCLELARACAGYAGGWSWGLDLGEPLEDPRAMHGRRR
jgi:hypothetical protein